MPSRRRRAWRGVAPVLESGQTMSDQEYEIWREEHTWDPARDTGLVIQDDLSPAEWIAALLEPGTFEVRMMVPQGFGAYARLFFPFVISDDLRFTWTEMAKVYRRVAHALMEKETLTLGPEGETARWTCFDGFAPEQCDALVPLLSRYTSSASAWFLLWDGWGDLNERAFAGRPKLHHPMRDYYLLSGPLSALKDSQERPNYCWPDDRAWCVVTDTDFEWAYVAGSEALIEAILAASVLDAYATKPENPAHSGMDTINDPDGTTPRD